MNLPVSSSPSFIGGLSRSFAGSLFGSLLFASASTSYAMPQAVDISMVLRSGDTLPGGDTLLGFRDPQIADTGRWGTIAGVAGPGLGSLVVIVDGQVILKEGDTLSGGDTVVAIGELSISASGDVGVLYNVDDPSSSGTIGKIRVGSNTLLSEGDTLSSTGDLVTSILGFDFDGAGLMARVKLANPGGPDLEASVYGVAIPAGGLNTAVVNIEGDIMNGTTLPLLSVGDELQVSYDETALAATTAIPISLSGPSGPVNALVSNGTVIAEDGGIGPLAGTTWSFPFAPRAHANYHVPELLVVGNAVDGGGTSLSGVFLGNTAVVLEGSPLANTGLTAAAFQDASITLASDGTPIYTVPTASGDQVTMAGSEVLIQTGVTTVGGQVIDNLNALLFGQYFGATNNGRELLQIVRLGNGDQALIRIDRGIEDPVECPTVANSTGAHGVLEAAGSRVLSDNDLRLRMSDLPPSSFGYLLVSLTSTVTMNPGGSTGNLCLGGNIGRFVDQVQASSMAGTIITTVDVAAIPQPTGAVVALAGDTWLFQGWHRDSIMGTPTSNFTAAVSVTFE